jgi:hypothetical protein
MTTRVEKAKAKTAKEAEAFIENVWQASEVEDENTARQDANSKKIKKQLAAIQKYFKSQGVKLSHGQIINMSIAWVYQMIDDSELPFSPSAMALYIKDTIDGIGEPDSYDTFSMGDYVSLKEWAKTRKMDQANASRYAKAGRIPGAKKIDARTWIVPENSRLIK